MLRPIPADLRQRLKWAHELYFEGLIKQVRTNAEGRALTRDVDEYVNMRRGTIGVYPSVVMTEWAGGVDLPEDVAKHPSIFKLMQCSADHVMLVNDILSYKKDLVSP